MFLAAFWPGNAGYEYRVARWVSVLEDAGFDVDIDCVFDHDQFWSWVEANDPELYNNLNDAACMLTRLMPRVDRILRDVEVFADKIARHPESLGVGGAINPSSGLKTVPTGSTSWSRPPGH